MVFYCDVNGICQTERPECSDRPGYKPDLFISNFIFCSVSLIGLLLWFAAGIACIACYKKLSKIFGWIKISKRFQSLLFDFWLAFYFVVFVLFIIKISN